jgi:hypothetical protein
LRLLWQSFLQHAVFCDHMSVIPRA